MIASIVIVLVSIVYCEFLWMDIKNGKQYKSIQRIFTIVYLFNYALSIYLSTGGTLIFAVIVSLYSIVLVPDRYTKLIAEHGNINQINDDE